MTWNNSFGCALIVCQMAPFVPVRVVVDDLVDEHLGLVHPQPHVQRVQAEDTPDHERDAPAERDHRRPRQGGGQDRRQQRARELPDRAREVDEARPQAAPLLRRGLGDVRLRGRQLAAVGQALRESGQHEDDRCPYSNRRVVRAEPDREAADRGRRDRQRHRQLPTPLVGDPAEQQTAEGPREEPDREHDQRVQYVGNGVAAVEELGGEERRERGVDTPVKPLHGVAGPDSEERVGPALGRRGLQVCGRFAHDVVSRQVRLVKPSEYPPSPRPKRFVPTGRRPPG